MAKAKKPDAPPDPDKLKRESPGSYRSGDGRFEVRQGGVGWYVVDLERTNELGQELLHGPFPSLKDAQADIPEARKVVPLARPKPAPKAARQKEPPPPLPPKTWIERLPDDEQDGVRRLITAVERAGVDNAETLVKQARGSNEPLIAAALIEHKLNELIDDGDAAERRGRRELVRRVLAILADEGALTRSPLPGWEVSQRDPAGEGPRRVRPTV